MATPRVSPFEPVRAALAFFLLLGGVGFLGELGIHWLGSEALRLVGHADWDLGGSPLTPGTLGLIALAALPAPLMGMALMRGLNRESFVVFLGVVVGAIAGWVIWGGRSGGVGHFVYYADWQGLGRYLVMWAGFSPAILLVLVLASLWRAISVRSQADRRARRHGLADA